MKLLIRKDGRQNLQEGREHGISFALCVPNETGFEEIMPLSACKDYLNDAIYGELMHKKTEKIYGFSHTPVGIYKFDNIYLSCGEVTYDKYEDPTLIDLKPHIDFINKIEEEIGVNKTTIINTDKYPILILDSYWGKYPYLISAYCLFFREAKNFKNEDIYVYINKLRYNHLNTSIFNSFMKISKSPPVQDFTDKTIKEIHNTGIVNFLKNLKAEKYLKNYEKQQSK
jgi:hypothetical protein